MTSKFWVWTAEQHENIAMDRNGDDCMQSKFGGWGKTKSLVLGIANLCYLLEIYMELKREVWAGDVNGRQDTYWFQVGSLVEMAKGVIKDTKMVQSNYFRVGRSGQLAKEMETERQGGRPENVQDLLAKWRKYTKVKGEFNCIKSFWEVKDKADWELTFGFGSLVTFINNGSFIGVMDDESSKEVGWRVVGGEELETVK